VPWATLMPFEITTTRRFSAAHQLRLYDGSMEPLHGHNWRAKVTVVSAGVDSIGVVMDFHDLERFVDAVLSPLHNRHLNDVPPFTALNPSAENVALHIGQSLAKAVLPSGVALSRVEVWETDDNSAVFRP